MTATDARTTPVLLLRILMILLVVAAVPAIAFGLLLIAEDARETTDSWHGFGYWLGGLISVAGALAVVVGAMLLVLLRRAPRAAAITVLVLAGLGSLLAILSVPGAGPGALLFVVPLAAAGALAAWVLAPAP